MAGRGETENPRRHPRRLWQNGADGPGKSADDKRQRGEDNEGQEGSKHDERGVFGATNSEGESQGGADRHPPAAGETPSWWQSRSPGSDTDSEHLHSHAHSGSERQCVDLCPICRTADVVRANAPPEFKDQWETFQHEALTMLRSFIDGYMDHLNRKEEPTVEVEDIPVE